jgi:hypothetical protein
MLFVSHVPIVEWSTYEPIPVSVFIDDRSEAGLDAQSLLCYWRAYETGQPPPAFTADVLSPDLPLDWYVTEIPAQASGTTVDYFVHAADNTGREAGMPRTEPDAWYSFEVTLDPAHAGDLPRESAARLRPNFPNPFFPATTFSFELKYEGRVRLQVYDPQGRLVRTLVDERVGPGHHEIEWDGRSDSGRELSAGTYFYRLRAAGISYSRKAILSR